MQFSASVSCVYQTVTVVVTVLITQAATELAAAVVVGATYV